MLRKDLRSLKQTRTLSVELGVVQEADGSAELQQGGTKVLASILGPAAPRYARYELCDRAAVEVEVEVAVRPLGGAGASGEAGASAMEASRRRRKLSSFLQKALTPALLLDQPRQLILFSVLVLSDDGAGFAAALNACSLAALDAGLHMRYVPCAASICAMPGEAYGGGVGDSRGGGGGEGGDARCLLLDPSLYEEGASVAQYVFALAQTQGIGSDSGNSSGNSSGGSGDGGGLALLASECSGIFEVEEMVQALSLGSQAAVAVGASMRQCIAAKLGH
ncbi:ribosomal protein S5 domain 2-type protein [Ochromonadaceae sp. CCMP2298]|nr:ribosomal protein S5 domain 2-type protein [Ochromonadaceae sp. CCMP2298]